MKNDNDKAQYNPENERAKYNYRYVLQHIDGKSDNTIRAILQGLRKFESYIGFKPLQIFNKEIAHKYVQYLLESDKSIGFANENLRHVREFLKWLERQRGYKSKINYNDIGYLNISHNQRREGKASHYQKSYKFEQIIDVVRAMPDTTEREKRDKAMISLQALCTLRISELRTVKINNVIEEDGVWFIHITPKNMDVKFAKTREAVFISLTNDIKENVISWYQYLISLGFKDNDPLFPIIDNRFNQKNLLEQSIKKEGIKSNTTIRAVFKKAFENAGLTYINPHTFRKTLVIYAQTQSPEFLNAVRQNLGHSSINTTLSSYGQLSSYDQRRIIAGIGTVV